MRWSKAGLWLAAAAPVVLIQGCQDDVARTQIQEIRTYIGHQNADGSFTGLLAWLDRVQVAVCNLEDHTTPPNTSERLCVPEPGDTEGTPNPPPPPPWGGD